MIVSILYITEVDNLKKRIVFFIGGLNYGGMERVVFIAEELFRDTYDVKIVTLYQTKADYEKKKNYYDLDVPPGGNAFIILIKRLIRTIKMKKKLKPDIVFSFGMYLNYLNVFSHFFYKNEKIIAGIRSYDWLTIPFFNSKIDSWVMNKFDSVNSVSEKIFYDAERYWHLPKSKNSIIYNPYDIKYICQKAEETVNDYVFDPNFFYISTMGRLTDQKGYDHLIRAVKHASNNCHNLQVLIMGNGNRRDDLQKLIQAYNLENVIHLIGGKSNPYSYIRKSNVYILSSMTEGFPNALSEAMCIGIPTISVNCKSGPAEIFEVPYNYVSVEKQFVETRYGILVCEMTEKPDYSRMNISAEEMALGNAIIHAYNKRKVLKKMGMRGQKRMEEFSYDVFHKKMFQILEG